MKSSSHISIYYINIYTFTEHLLYVFEIAWNNLYNINLAQQYQMISKMVLYHVTLHQKVVSRVDFWSKFLYKCIYERNRYFCLRLIWMKQITGMVWNLFFWESKDLLSNRDKWGFWFVWVTSWRFGNSSWLW